MIKKLVLPIVLLILLVIAFQAGTTPLSVQAQEGGDDNGNISHANSGIKTFTWTAEEMANAQPMPLLMREGEPDAATTLSWGSHTHNWSNPNGPSGAGGNPGPDYNKSLSTNYFSYPPPFSRFTEFSNVNRFPLRTIGVLYFTQRGSTYRCSGAIAYRNIVWTAGHCVHDGSGQAAGWSDNYVFYPSWRNGENPKFGNYSNWENAWARASWVNTGEFGEDFAAVVFSSAAYPGDDLGWLGFETGATPVQNWAVIGWPAETPFNGNLMTTCQTSFGFMDTSTNPDTVGFGCDMTGGSSGGPGIRKINGRGGYINTNMSYGYIGYKWASYGPYFGDEAWSLFCTSIESGTTVNHPDC